MKRYNYIYLITNKLNGKIYIGKHSTDDLNDRYMGSGKIIKQAIKKYGIENFTKEILAYTDTIDTLNYLERFYIRKYKAQFVGYNLTDGGEGVLGYKHNDDTKIRIGKASKGRIKSKEECEKLSVSKIGEKNPMFGKTSPMKGHCHTEETKLKISKKAKEAYKLHPEKYKGRVVSDETKQKISEASKGRIPWNKGKTGIYSEETKQKMRNAKLKS